MSASEIDSLLQLEENSSITFRLAYTSKALFAGRDFGITQTALMPDITYYHKSGLYAELTGLSYSKSTPKYELTFLSAGYTGFVGNLLYSAEISKTFYTQPDPENPNPLPYALALTGSYDIGKISTNLGYTFMFGSETAHRINFGPSFFKKWTNIGFIDRLSINPGLNLVLGNQSSNYSQNWNTIASGINTSTGTGTGFNALAAQRQLNNPNLPAVIRQRLIAMLKKNGTTANVATAPTNYFGLMAYDLSLPLSATVGAIRFSLTPHIIKPVKLFSTEDISTKLNSYFSFSVTYTLKMGFGV